jgi:hypothetical protein
MDNLNAIAKQIIAIPETEFDFSIKECEKQANYINPLKAKRSADFQNLGKYNLKVVNLMYELKLLIESGKDSGMG